MINIFLDTIHIYHLIVLTPWNKMYMCEYLMEGSQSMKQHSFDKLHLQVQSLFCRRGKQFHLYRRYSCVGINHILHHRRIVQVGITNSLLAILNMKHMLNHRECKQFRIDKNQLHKYSIIQYQKCYRLGNQNHRSSMQLYYCQEYIHYSKVCIILLSNRCMQLYIAS